MTVRCNVLHWLDPKFSEATAPLCAVHDDAYIAATTRVKAGLPRGGELTRLRADFGWIKGAWKLDKLRAAIYGTGLVLGGWYLWYDVDKKLGW